MEMKMIGLMEMMNIGNREMEFERGGVVGLASFGKGFVSQVLRTVP